MAAVTTGDSLDTSGVVSPRCSTTVVQDSPLDKCAAHVYTQVRQELFVAWETTQNPMEIPPEAPRIVDQSVDVPPVAAPAPADDAPVPHGVPSWRLPLRCLPSSPLKSSELAAECTGISSVYCVPRRRPQLESVSDAKYLCLDVGHHDIVDGVRDGNRWPGRV